MFCLHLRIHAPADATWSVATCAAHNSLYVPSLEDQGWYCRSGDHRQCPILRRPEAAAPLKWIEHGRSSLFPVMQAA